MVRYIYSAMLYLQIECRMKQGQEQYHYSEQWHPVLQIHRKLGRYIIFDTEKQCKINGLLLVNCCSVLVLQLPLSGGWNGTTECKYCVMGMNSSVHY